MAGKKGKSGTNPNSIANLSPITERTTPEQRREIASKGGKAKAEAQRQRKEMKDMIQDIFSIGIKKGKVYEDIKSLEDAKGKNLTVGQALILAQVKKAMTGDTRAMEFLRDTMGEKPTNKQEVTAKIVESPLNSILAQLTEPDDEENNNIDRTEGE